MPGADRPLRVVELVPSLVLGGAEAFGVALSDAMLEAGHEVWLVTLNEGEALLSRMSPALRERRLHVPKRGRVDPTVLPRLAARLRALGPDVVHTHLFTGLAWGTVAARLARVPVVVYTEHACHADDEAWVPWLRRPLSGMVDHVVGCSPAAVEAVARHRWAPYAPVSCIDNGVPMRGRPRAALDGLHLGTVGRLVPIKGQRFLVEAVALLRDRGLDVRLTIVGDGPLRAELEAQVVQLALGDRVTLAGPSDDVPGWMGRFDLFVLPSLSEALPMTLLEAGAAGLPLLVTTGGGGPTLLEAGAGGWAVPPGDAGALAERIAAYAALDLDARRALGEASRAVVEARYGIAGTAERYVALFRALRGG